MNRLGKFSYSTPTAILAVDGGNSKTDVALVDATGAVLGAARGPGASHHHLGVPAAMDTLEALIEAAGHDAGLPATERPLAAVGVWCLAGVDFPADDQALGPAIAGRRWRARRCCATTCSPCGAPAAGAPGASAWWRGRA
jgi:hypothetical protein